MEGADSFKTFVTIHHTSVELLLWKSLTISYIPYQIVFIKDYYYCYLSRICKVLKITYLQQTMFLGNIVN